MEDNEDRLSRDYTLLAGSILTVLYLAGIFIIRPGLFSELGCLDLNELGDFLAGVFAPLAFLWLVLGYFLQRREISQNTKALELQAEELNSSVEQQKQLVETAKEDLKLAQDIRSAKSQPNFTVLEADVIENDPTPDHILVSLNFKNNGAPARDVRLVSYPRVLELERFKTPQYWHQQNKVIKFSFLKEKFPNQFEVRILYRSEDGQEFEKRIELSRINDRYDIDSSATPESVE